MLKSINAKILKIEVVFAKSIAGLAALIIILQIFARYLFRAPFSWPEELAVFLLIWLTFIGASVLLKRNEHIKVSLVIEKLPKKLCVLLNLITDISMLFALIVMAYQSYALIPIQNISSTVALHIPRGYFFLPVVVSSVSMFLFVLQGLSDQIKSIKENI